MASCCRIPWRSVLSHQATFHMPLLPCLLHLSLLSLLCSKNICCVTKALAATCLTNGNLTIAVSRSVALKHHLFQVSNAASYTFRMFALLETSLVAVERIKEYIGLSEEVSVFQTILQVLLINYQADEMGRFISVPRDCLSIACL